MEDRVDIGIAFMITLYTTFLVDYRYMFLHFLLSSVLKIGMEEDFLFNSGIEEVTKETMEGTEGASFRNIHGEKVEARDIITKGNHGMTRWDITFNDNLGEEEVLVGNVETPFSELMEISRHLGNSFCFKIDNIE
jgi:hypothetical protein